MSTLEKICHRWPEISIIVLTGLFFGAKNLFSFLTVQDFAGRDLVTNYAFTHLMQQNLLNGQVFAWTNQYLLGFLSFELYPPLFFVFTSLLNLVTGQILGLSFWFKLVVFSSVFFLPLLVYAVSRDTFGKQESFLAGTYTLLFIFVYTPVSQAYQVFSTGLVAQGFSFFLLIASIGFMLQNDRKSKVLAGVLLGFSALSHPFVGLTGFILSGFILLLDRKPANSLPGLIGGLIFLPWFLIALQHLPYTPSFTFTTANTGIFLYLLLPLIILGGYRGMKKQALLFTFFTLLFISVVELPVIAQELRFYTYALGFSSILAGFGAYEILEHLDGRFNIDRRVLLVLLVLPTIGFVLHANLPQTWEFEGDAEPLYDKLDDFEQGRVIVETVNSSVHDSFVVQSMISLETKHWGVNDVHLDSSTSANYILTLEAWISEEMVYNSICRTCDTEVSNRVVDARMDDLGIRYAVVRTEYSKNRLQQFMIYHGKYGDYWLFENREGYQMVEELEHYPVGLEGNYSKWRKVNDLVFTSNISRELVWIREGMNSQASTVIDMENLSAVEVVERIRQAELEKIGNDSWIKRVKKSYFPSKTESGLAGKFNTVITESPEEPY